MRAGHSSYFVTTYKTTKLHDIEKRKRKKRKEKEPRKEKSRKKTKTLQ